MQRLWMVILCASTVAWSAVTAPAAPTLREVARIRGQGKSQLLGLGLVVGLNGTGDKGEELAMARPLAEVLRRMGNPLPSLSELESSKSVALVMVHCEVPRQGAKIDDELDIRITVIHSAKSLDGGILLTAALTSAVPGGPLYAFAQGEIVIESSSTPTVGFVRGGAQIVRDINTMPEIRTSFDLIIDEPAMSGWGPAAAIANEINQQYLLTMSRIADPIATVVDERTIRVTVPEAERAAPAAFVGDVMATDIASAMRLLPAQVICNTRTGAILITGDVEVSPAVITHKNLTITTTVPPIEPTAAAPQLRQDRWAKLQTGARPKDTARLGDLIAAFDQLDVSPLDQIQILQMLHKAGKLHARLIVD